MWILILTEPDDTDRPAYLIRTLTIPPPIEATIVLTAAL